MSGCLSRGVTFCAGDRLTVIGIAMLKAVVERYTTNPRDQADLLRDLSQMESSAVLSAVPALSDVALHIYMQATKLDPETGHAIDRGDGSVPLRCYMRESSKLIAGALFEDIVRLTPGFRKAIAKLKACRPARAEAAHEPEPAEAPRLSRRARAPPRAGPWSRTSRWYCASQRSRRSYPSRRRNMTNSVSGSARPVRTAFAAELPTGCPDRRFWEAVASQLSSKSLILLVGAQGLEPWTR